MLKKAGELAREVPGIAPIGNRKYPTFKGYVPRGSGNCSIGYMREWIRQHFWGEGVVLQSGQWDG
ncbi:MAG: hypothetical protein AL399_06130 [Candidatus [Bacteroides] periocalifornicus]|uniref:Uncharacterized protein n=1 Tax=Candidatus [Bacteroides] periocalifornicus TaxID=1702214 RepID=A0A0Q4B7S2_9BACT|nr:MAG: hypothetical protein AL399_06130 [Candidatus [Bacteroides] periocalifornicus]